MSEEITQGEKTIRDNNRDVIAREDISLVAGNNDRHSGTVKDIVFNTHEVPLITLESTKEEEDEATEQAKKLAMDGKNEEEVNL